MSKEPTMRTDQVMRALADGISSVLGEKNRFVLLTFTPSGDAGSQTNYISNCNREDLLVALKEVVARFEGRVHDGGEARN